MNSFDIKPVVIFRFAEAEGPGYFATFLEEQGIPWQLIRIDEGEDVPASILAYGGMVLMGGPMSVNDDLPWTAPLLQLIQEAVALDVPLLGHCLGGQLISKALGAKVTQNTVKEIGWSEVTVISNETAKHWFGEIESFNGFHWHGETFALPQDAIHLLKSRCCEHQAYAVGKHLAFQCHIEMTEEMVNTWCEIGAGEIVEAQDSPAVQSLEGIQQMLSLHCFFLNKVAKQVYAQWIKGLV
jgi:GMP synthase-like glutamine amidotransferase